MNAPTYINTRLDFEKYNNYLQDLHKKRLTSIKNKLPTISSAPKLPKKPKLVITPEILEENKKLVKKLINIAQQKSNFNSLTPSHSTLNFFSRKKEYKRIDEENRKFLNKLRSCSGSIRGDILEKQFSISQEYKSRISRSFILKKRQNKSFRSEKKNQVYMSNINLFRY